MPEVFAATRVPGFNDGMLWDPPETVEELAGPLARARAAWREARSYQFSIDREGEFAGRIALRPGDGEGTLDVGYWTLPRFQGQGIMTEALRAVTALGFETMGARAITAGYATWNEASRKVLERAGFRLVRIDPEGFVKGDRAWDEAHLRLERDEWAAET